MVLMYRSNDRMRYYSGNAIQLGWHDSRSEMSYGEPHFKIRSAHCVRLLNLFTSHRFHCFLLHRFSYFFALFL